MTRANRHFSLQHAAARSMLLLWLCSPCCQQPLQAQPPALVPQPRQENAADGESRFELGETVLAERPANPLWQDHLLVFGDALERLCQTRLTVRADKRTTELQLLTKMDATLAAEEYRLTVDNRQIRIAVSSIKGLSHATATLLQLIGNSADATVRACDIKDQPACGYRSLMVDIGRNPHSLECLKEAVDLLWFYKVDPNW